MTKTSHLLTPIALSAALVAGGLLTGCRTDPGAEPDRRGGTNVRSDVRTGDRMADREMDGRANGDARLAGEVNGDDERGVMNLAAVSGLPLEVRDQIMADLGANGATITDVNTQRTDAGVVYRVTYIEEGRPRSALYDREGLRLRDDDPREGNEGRQPGRGIFDEGTEADDAPIEQPRPGSIEGQGTPSVPQPATDRPGHQRATGGQGAAQTGGRNRTADTPTPPSSGAPQAPADPGADGQNPGGEPTPGGLNQPN